jgi:hypothetical protein
MEDPKVHARIQVVEARATRLERWLKFTVLGWLVTVALLLASALMPPHQVAAQGTNGATDVLRARQFVVVDEKGTERIVIGPVPDPQILGRRMKRRSAGTGVQLNDANGNERGGLAVMDDGSVVVGLDDEAGRERAHLYFIPKKGSGLLLQGEGGKQTISLSIPPEGEQSASPQLEMTDRAGNRVASVPARK